VSSVICDNCKRQGKCRALFLDLSDQTTECIYSPSKFDAISAPRKQGAIIKQEPKKIKKAYVLIAASSLEALEIRVASMLSASYLPIGNPIEWNEGLVQAMLISDTKMRGHSG